MLIDLEKTIQKKKTFLHENWRKKKNEEFIRKRRKNNGFLNIKEEKYNIKEEEKILKRFQQRRKAPLILFAPGCHAPPHPPAAHHTTLRLPLGAL